MTWLARLNQTYENHAHIVGQFEKKRNDREYALIPVSHTTQSAHIEVYVDGEGNFISAKVVDKSDSSTIIPCTEASASRTSAPVPHPLFDKLVYLAGDYARYCEEAKGTPHNDYMAQLQDWCESEAVHPKVKSVYAYLRRGTLMEDLIRAQVLWTDERHKLIEKWTSAEEERLGLKPELFKVIASDQSAAFVRFAVQIPGDAEPRLWRDLSVQQAFIRYYDRKLTELELCYVTGERLPYADKHASRIRNSGDKSKLISANDTSGFTFRGRFRTSREAAAVSYEVSQKAHNALKWLIDKQSYALDGKVFLVWGTGQLEMPDPLGDGLSLGMYDEADEEEENGDSTRKQFAGQVRRALQGYRYDGDYEAHVIVMVLDAATPGRMSIVYYRDMNKELFLDRLQHWHETCSWRHRFHKDEEKRTLTFEGAPASRDIAYAAYGPRASDKVVKGLMERMLPCIVDGRKIPLDIVRSVTARASNPIGLDEWEWEKTLSIACALINKTYESEGFSVSLDVRNTDRSYLFGRMLAIADVLERRALGRDEKRATNAIRYMNAFAQRPGRTWTIIQSNLQPYQARMGTDAGYYNRLLDEVGAQLEAEHFTDRPLSGLYLLGFYSQRHDLYQSKKDRETNAAQDGKLEPEHKEEGEI
ncbi:type I-C CRISPR-associated protein Cas8c/Csd1 [Paenibacillus puerhi]|uniref:type I-C CRISPR-associated protein Cas8c/Csd1 n=1 Tax=Paenibacillus puerhi TaxID=2692622 RepID=UPI001359F346|nr:type I-C CRISPR-associated protein Cas8c/Csd1 [Paenibacillus puerhi]